MGLPIARAKSLLHHLHRPCPSQDWYRPPADCVFLGRAGRPSRPATSQLATTSDGAEAPAILEEACSAFIILSIPSDAY